MTRITLSRERMLSNVSTSRHVAPAFVFLFCLFAVPLYAHAGFQVDTNSTLTTSLVSYYKLDETSTGSSATDSWGTHDLTNPNSLAFDTGKIGNAASSGPSNTTKYLGNTSDNYGIDGGAISISCWANTNFTPSGGNWYVIAAQGSAASHVGYEMVYADSGGTPYVRFVRFKGSNQYVSAAQTLTNGTWYNLVLTYDGTNVEGWVNGTSIGTVAASGSGSGVTDGFKLYNPDFIDNSNLKFSGMVDECGVWSKKLSNQEISDLWNGGNGDTLSSAPYITGGVLQQYKSDATSTITAGSETDESTVVFGAGINGSNSTGTAQLQIEVRPAGVSFSNTSTTTSGSYLSGSYATTSVSFDPGSYHWQARVLDGTGATSTWTLFGPSSTSTDFVVDPAMSAYFNGSSTWAWDSNIAFNSSDPFTIELWYNTTSTDAMELLRMRPGSDSLSNGFTVWKDPGSFGAPYFYLYCGTGATSSVVQLGGNRSINSADGHWHHIAVTKYSAASSTNAFRVYFDGAQQMGGKCFNSTSTDDIWIGGDYFQTYPVNASASIKLFKGYIDEVRIWNTERSDSDISTYSVQEVTSTSGGLLDYWRFNSTSTNLVTHNATSVQYGSPTFSTSTPFGHFLLGFSSVSSSAIFYNASTTYWAQWNAGVDTWNASTSGAVSIASSTYVNAGLVVEDASSSVYWDKAGEYCNVPYFGVTGCVLSGGSCPAKDTIFLNTYVLNNRTDAERQHTAAHELGHALGLDHSILGNMLYPYITSQTWLGARDLLDYNSLY